MYQKKHTGTEETTSCVRIFSIKIKGKRPLVRAVMKLLKQIVYPLFFVSVLWVLLGLNDFKILLSAMGKKSSPINLDLAWGIRLFICGAIFSFNMGRMVGRIVRQKLYFKKIPADLETLYMEVFKEKFAASKLIESNT